MAGKSETLPGPELHDAQHWRSARSKAQEICLLHFLPVGGTAGPCLVDATVIVQYVHSKQGLCDRFHAATLNCFLCLAQRFVRQVLPAFRGKVYRGINLRLAPHLYEAEGRESVTDG